MLLKKRAKYEREINRSVLLTEHKIIDRQKNTAMKDIDT
jgi:hypothetical protein